MDFVKNKKEFEEYKSRYLSLFTDDDNFDKESFNNEFNEFLKFDFDLIYEESFLKGMKKFLTEIKDDNFVFFTINPSPDKYFYTHFKKFSVILIDLKCSEEELNEIMMKDPGDSPSDAISINSNDIAIFSFSNKWAILGSRELEECMIGFTNTNVMNLFMNSFNGNYFYNI